MKIFSSLKVTPLSNLYDSLELCEAFRLDNYEHIKPCYLYCVLFLVHKKSGIFSALVILFYKRYF